MPRIKQILNLSEYDEAIVIDNSDEPLGVDLPCEYVWMNGENTMYAGGINEAVKRLRTDHVVYYSVKRGMARKKTWVDEITAPLCDPRCGMAGTLLEHPLSLVSNDLHQTSNLHVQGGVWAARRSVMEEFPYGRKFPQVYSDLWISWKLQKAGYRLCEVPSVKAVHCGVVRNVTRYSFFVDYREQWERYDGFTGG